MSNFTELPVWGGDEDFHLNYFRTYIRPRAGATLPTGGDLLNNMHKFMNPHTATVDPDVHRWNGQPTLSFRGVAVLRPFALAEKVPENIRTMLVPQKHTDSVGLAVPVQPHSFTAQTLKREYETEDDRWVRTMVLQRTGSAPRGSLAELDNTLREMERKFIPLYRRLDDKQQEVSTRLGDIAVNINQHHFLAGRRSFRIGTVGGFGPRHPGTTDSDWVFETAAVERFSLKQFRYVTNYAMGGGPRVVRPVWIEMGQQLARFYGQPLFATEFRQEQYRVFSNASTKQLYKEITSRHVALVPGVT